MSEAVELPAGAAAKPSLHWRLPTVVGVGAFAIGIGFGAFVTRAVNRLLWPNRSLRRRV